jgi:hypothetical protein
MHCKDRIGVFGASESPTTESTHIRAIRTPWHVPANRNRKTDSRSSFEAKSSGRATTKRSHQGVCRTGRTASSPKCRLCRHARAGVRYYEQCQYCCEQSPLPAAGFSPTHYVYQHPQLVRPERLSDRLVTMIRKMGAEPQEPRFFRPWSTPGAAWGDKRPCNSGAADDPKAA